jgi:hypothetical protein
MAATRTIIAFSLLVLAQAASWPWDDGKWPWQSDDSEADSEAEEDDEAFKELDSKKDNKKFLAKAPEKKQDNDKQKNQEDTLKDDDKPTQTLSELGTSKADLESVSAEAEKSQNKAGGTVTIKLNSQLQVSSKTQNRQKSSDKKWGEEWGALAEDLLDWGSTNPMTPDWGQEFKDAYNYSPYSKPNAAANPYVQPLQFGQHSTFVSQADSTAEATAAKPRRVNPKGGVVSVKLHSELQTSAKLSKSPHRSSQ